MKQKILFLTAFITALVVTFQIDQTEFYNRNNSSTLFAEYENLVNSQKHFVINSQKWNEAEYKINKIKRRLKGYVKSEAPDEYVKMQMEIRTPFGKDLPEYEMSYLVKEFQKSKQINKTSGEILPWINRGPGNVAGRARGLVVDPVDTDYNTWYVGSVGGGIWKTTDAGESWRELTANLPVLPFSTVVMSESNNNIMYAGSGESFFSIDVINGNGIYKSTDRGETWAPLLSTINNLDFNNTSRITVDPDDENILLASTTVGRYKLTEASATAIMKSTDGGSTWTKVHEITANLGVWVNKILQLVATPGNFNVQYAAVDNEGILKSTDAGDTWFEANDGITDFTGRFEIAISPLNPDKIYAASEGTNITQLHVSEDAGVTWENVSITGSTRDWLGSQGWYDNTIAVNPEDDDIVFVGGVRLHRITINGLSGVVSDLSTGSVHVDHHNLVPFLTSDGSYKILNANDGGIGVSGDKFSNWTAPINGLITTQFYGTDKKPGSSAYAGGMQDNGTWISPEDPTINDNWTFFIGGDGYEVSWHFNDPEKIIGGSQFNGLARSLDGGFTVLDATNGLSDVGGGNAPFITKIGKTNDDPDLLFAVGKSGVWKSTNFGANWRKSTLSNSSLWYMSSFMDVRVSRANPDVVWAGARFASDGRIFVSTDRGDNFEPVELYDIDMGTISGMSTHPTEDSTAYLLFSFANYPKILRTTDLGQNWEDISGFNGVKENSSNGFPDVAVYDLLVMPHTPDTIWAGTEIGLLESTDNGVSWNFADNGFPSAPIWQMTHVEEEVVIATHGRGIWSVNIPGLSSGKTFLPLLKSLTQSTDNSLLVNLFLRSAYDSTVVTVNDEKYLTIESNLEPKAEVVNYPIDAEGSYTVSITSYKNGEEYTPDSKTINATILLAPRDSYITDFSSGEDNFYGTGFSIKTVTGFDDEAIHSNHSYSNNSNYTYYLKIPIIINENDPMVTFDNIALIEPGEPGSSFGDSDFWDYVIVEGSIDGISWMPLIDGYDARADQAWLSAYNSNSSGKKEMYVNQSINLLDTFTDGDIIQLRFRLVADAFVTGWGWAIDNLVIQGNASSVEDNKLVNDFYLAQNYPNPFNPSTTISFSLPQQSFTKINIYNSLGELVTTLINEKLNAGTYKLNWNGSNSASGVYFYRIEAGSFYQTKKMILLK